MLVSMTPKCDHVMKGIAALPACKIYHHSQYNEQVINWCVCWQAHDVCLTKEEWLKDPSKKKQRNSLIKNDILHMHLPMLTGPL